MLFKKYSCGKCQTEKRKGDRGKTELLGYESFIKVELIFNSCFGTKVAFENIA